MFDPVDPKQSFSALERGILKYWQEEDIFKRSLGQRRLPQGDRLETTQGSARVKKDETFSFYDGPPFATGLPHYGHLLAGTIKDVIPRYQTMQGKYVQRRFGWDCHGLPVEYEIEKEHGLQSRLDIEKMGVKAFNDLCRKAVQRFTKEWRVTVERMGRFVDMDWDYRTMDADYMESIWWAFKKLADKKLIYEGHKPMHICPRCQTPLSNFEVTQGYKEITDQAVTAMFELHDEPGTFVLAWTTTPWTLPGNLFLAVGPAIPYARIQSEGKVYILAEPLVERIFKDRPHERIGTVTAPELKGRHYKPLFPYYEKEYADRAFRIVEGDFVTLEDGTGVVHIATGFGEDDFAVGKKEGIHPPLQHIGMDGKFKAEVTDFAGEDVKPKDDSSKMDKKIAQYLEQHGGLFAKESYKHTYPHCWRCDSPLLNYATSSWFVEVEKIKKDMLAANAKTEWVPAHLRDGRFGKWLEGARDWAISRNRYWGTPLPIWRCAETKDLEVIGSRDDLMKKCPIRFTKVTVMRHGESDGNVMPIYQGVLPGTNLTAKGKTQALFAGEKLKAENVRQIYASPFARTQQTAQIVSEQTGATMQTDERLREIAFGEYEGKSIDFTDLTFVKARRAHKLETNQVESIYHFPGMETWSDVSARTSAFLRETLPRHRGEHIVLVTHADLFLTIKHFFTKEDPLKLTHQPYPSFATPITFYWDHDAELELDLHKETVDGISWPVSKSKQRVHATLIRHAATEWNLLGKAQGGDRDVPLSEQGKAEAEQVAGKIGKKKFDIIISSDLLRARSTAEIIAQKIDAKEVLPWASLRERSFGDWCEKPADELMKTHPGIHPKQSPSFHHETPPGGESLSQFLTRLQGAYEQLMKDYTGKKVLLVVHKGVIQGLSTIAKSLTHQEGIETAIDNAGMVELEFHPLMRRIPDVLDCWFESGSMPYAQSHFPFNRSNQTKTPVGFPANFIAEGIDQTRGWFYTLIVLSAALFKKPAFLHCIVNGTVLAEDGKKMSKRLKNYPEPLGVVEKHGADSVRFALMSSPAVRAEDLRFSERVVAETVRSVILPLWNTYAFFVTYANAAKWEPGGERRKSKHPLDEWIRAEVQDLANRMTEQLDQYDLSATCAELHDTIDSLTNWYVRLSRRRFAGKGAIHGEKASDVLHANVHEEEQHDALSTLYEVLLTLNQLLAPFCPFVTDAMYLNLARKEHGSIHLTDWPETRTLKKKEQQLIAKNRLLRTIVSLGLRIRSEQKQRIRQPLQKAAIAVPKALMEEAAMTKADAELLQEELNVKFVECTEDPGSLAQTIALVDARKVGPRLGARVQELIQAGKRGEFSAQPDGSILILDERLTGEEVSIVYRGREGENVAGESGVVVSLDTTLTEDLKREGDARDLVRAIQQLRKDRGLQLDQTITLSVSGADDLLKDFGHLIEQETNAKFGSAEGEEYPVELEGRKVGIRFTIHEKT